MTAWIKCSEDFPKEEGPLLVKINGKIFLGHCHGIINFHYIKEDNVIYFLIKSTFENIPGNCVALREIKTGEWVLPCWFRQPDEWMYVP